MFIFNLTMLKYQLKIVEYSNESHLLCLLINVLDTIVHDYVNSLECN